VLAQVTMTKNGVTTRKLVNALRNLNFVERQRRGHHVMLAHRHNGALVTVPTSRQFAPLIYLLAIEKLLEGFDIISSVKFKKKIGMQAG
jgi:predicted RNA binding protein YcfA (HicA-like mRNA interferase family)